ncbi:MAG: DUF2283 domain-containing protein [Alphaproteobacteria bacterium]|nr:DUF2283 domain-containing protein [Alphaproteobacteria bacterium]
MTTTKASYDADADAISVRFAPDGVSYAESEEVAPGVVLDYDAQGRVIGVELLYVSDLLSAGKAEDAAGNPAAE